MADNYRPGDHYQIDERTGFKVRASETRKEWTGAIVHRDVYEPRQPQDFVRGVRDKQSVDNPRPRPVDTFIGPLTTEIAASAVAGDFQIEVRDSARFAGGDRIGIMLDNGDRFEVQVQEVPDGTHLTLAGQLPWSASVGMAVVDYSAVAPADIG